MANYLDANPNDAALISSWGSQMVPIARGGFLLYLMTHRNAHKAPLDTPLSVEDYVVGLELLGYCFHLQRGHDGTPSLFREEPNLSPSWDAHALRISEAFGTGRMDEVRAFIIARDDAL